MEYEIRCEGEIIARNFDRFHFMIFVIILIQIPTSSSVLPQDLSKDSQLNVVEQKYL